MIVIGYQGIGKSTLARKSFRYIDLESSALRQGDVRWHNWYEPYCMIAEWLSKQGYTVFVSSHKEVRGYLNEFCKEPFCAVVPSESLKDEWIDKLKKRFEQFPTDKNYRAYMNAADRYTENVREIKEDVEDVREITSMSYELDRLIAIADTPQPEAQEKWETPPKYEPPEVNTTCVSVIGALLNEVPEQTDCEACELDGKADVCKICRVSNYEPQTDCPWK